MTIKLLTILLMGLLVSYMESTIYSIQQHHDKELLLKTISFTEIYYENYQNEECVLRIFHCFS